MIRCNRAEVLDVAVVVERPTAIAYELPINAGELQAIFAGGLQTLFELLETRQFASVEGSAELRSLQPDEFFASLPNKFRPEKAHDVEMVVHYCIAGEAEGEDCWSVAIKDQGLHVRTGLDGNRPTVTVRAGRDAFMKLINGQVTPFQLFTAQKLEVLGQPFTMMQMAECFDGLFAGPKQD